MQFSFLRKNEDGTLQFQEFNMAAHITSVYDSAAKSLVVLLKHKYKAEVPLYSNSSKLKGTRIIDKDFELVINRREDILRFLKLTAPWMTPLEISTLLDESPDIPSAPVLEPIQPNP